MPDPNTTYADHVAAFMQKLVGGYAEAKRKASRTVYGRTCPRCEEWHDGEPDGCRDPSCPLLDGGAFDVENLEEREAAPPYPEFCTQPDKCAGKSYCQRDFCCAD